MSLNMKTLHQAWVKTAAVIEKTVQTTVQEVTGPKPLQDYDLLDQIGSAGPGLVWKLYSAKARSGSALSQQYPTVCVWVLDKKALSEARLRSGLTKACEDSFLDIIRGDAARLVRLRHPGVVHVVQALDESKNAMAMVTEPLFASVANTLGNVENIEKVPKELKGMEMGLLEVKHGLLQIAESLNFLHNNARLIHRAISPESVLITSSGSWKLGGFGFAVSADQSSGDTADGHGFHYAEYDVEDSVMPLQPCLNYTAPELVRSKATSVGCSSDVFSFGCLAYHLVARKPLFDCHNNVKMYMNTLTYLSSDAFSSIPPELVPDLQKMLSATEASRPTALDFTGSAFFRNDTRLRALRFLDHMLERDNMQKSEFLKALSDMWKDFDSRVLRYKVLPPLCAELRNMVMQPMILPMVLTIAESQDRSDFELSTLPALVPVLSTAAGETLLLLVKHADLVISKASQDHLVSHVLPLLIRAYDDNDARMQEEGLKRTLTLAKKLDIQLVKQGILPKVHGLALKTTVAAVRVNALLCLGDMVNMLDKPAVLEILQTIQRCTAVDHSAPTLMCTLGVANSVLKKYGLEFAAEHVLPLVTPLLIAQQLNVQQFAKYMLFVKDILRKIEEKRGVTLTDGCSEVRQSPAIDGSQPGLKKPVATAASNSSTKSSWDEDWPATTKGPTANPQSTTTNISSIQPKANQPTPVLSSSFIPSTSSVGSQQNVASCPPVDLEWPPRSSSTTPHLGDLGNHTQNNGSSSGGLDDIDPFANWPPRPSGPPSASGNSNNGTPVSGLSTSTLNGVQFPNSWGFNTVSSIGGLNQNQGSSMGGLNGVGPQNSIGGLNQNQGSSMGGLSGVGPQNSIGGLNQNQGSSMGGLSGVGPHNSIGGLNQNQGSSAWGSYNEKKTSADIGSIFSSGKSEQNALRLAPPPLTAVGRGRGSVSVRGRGRGRQGQQGSGQPPLLDLL